MNTIAVAAIASQSIRGERWSVVSIQAALPFFVDLSARHIFGYNKISPWAFSIVPHTQDGNSASTLMIGINGDL
ncbi:MAG: hypothetical protein L6Q37_11555 [Bdellovibrionaceae bacterium]|nr:hypothetical protein [Pseudobdellovibrionaceae bacterium]NUM59846.1 hypothetical protein [Pseudobdellovibrionaceae bacterium]